MLYEHLLTLSSLRLPLPDQDCCCLSQLFLPLSTHLCTLSRNLLCSLPLSDLLLYILRSKLSTHLCFHVLQAQQPHHSNLCFRIDCRLILTVCQKFFCFCKNFFHCIVRSCCICVFVFCFCRIYCCLQFALIKLRIYRSFYEASFAAFNSSFAASTSACVLLLLSATIPFAASRASSYFTHVSCV